MAASAPTLTDGFAPRSSKSSTMEVWPDKQASERAVWSLLLVILFKVAPETSRVSTHKIVTSQ